MSRILFDGCSLTAGFADPRNNFDITLSWPSFMTSNPSCVGYQGKDNHGIYLDTLKEITTFQYFDMVIVYWTYTDRHSYYEPEGSGRVVRGVDKKISDEIYERGNKSLQYMYTNMSLMYMYSLQSELVRKGINYYFITTMPEQHYRNASKFSNDNKNFIKVFEQIDRDRILNWQDDDLPCFDYKTDNWAHTLPVLFGTLHNCLNYDGVHLTEDGNKLFAEWVRDSINNGKNIPDWSIDKVFNWALNHTDVSDFHRYTRSGYHGAREYASKIKNYIYEGP